MRPLLRVFALMAAAALLAVACGSDSESDQATGGGTGFPLTVSNCGQQFTFDAAPTAAITMNQHVTEVLLALGLEDRMVGTAWLDSTIRPDLQAAYASVPVLADQYPSREQVLAAEPDIVIGGFASAFGDEAAGSRESLLDAGIGSYLTSGYCPNFSGPNSVDLVEEDIRNIGAIFGVSERAEQLIATVMQPIDDARSGVAGDDEPTVFVYDSGTDMAFTAAGFEMTTALIDLAGGRNVFDDVEDSFAEVSWEDVVDRDPDVILILNYGDTTADEKKDFLRTDPRISTLRAVQDDRIFVIDLTDVVPGVRNGDAVAAMASAFHGNGGDG